MKEILNSKYVFNYRKFFTDLTLTLKQKRFTTYQTIESNQQFIDRYSRIGFIRKVFSIFTYQAFLTAMITALVVKNQNISSLLRTNIKPTLMLSFLGQMATSFSLIGLPRLRYQFPINIIILSLYTICQSFIVGLIASTLNSQAVFLGTIQTFIVFLVMTAFSFQVRIMTKYYIYIYIFVSIILPSSLFIVHISLIPSLI